MNGTGLVMNRGMRSKVEDHSNGVVMANEVQLPGS